jgi:two-component system response regulator
VHSGSTPYLVIVEDNQADNFWLNRELKKANLGIPTTLFEDGQKALNFLSECSDVPAVLLLDLHLPNVSGLQLLRAIKGNPKLSGIIVFVIDESSSPKEVAECRELEVEGFLDKPVSAENLTRLLAPHLRGGVVDGGQGEG